MKMTVSQAMVECLKAENVKVVFGYPGAAICPFYDALLDAENDIRQVLVRQEANGGHAANGYARISGKPAVCIATSGPGATNLITAIATAYADSIPIVCITGQVNTDQIGSDVFQEADITGSAEPFVKHSYLLKNPEDTARVFKEAFYIARTGRPGPVLIDLPKDVMAELGSAEYPKTVNIRGYKPNTSVHIGQLKRALKMLQKAKKPLFLAGGGVIISRAQEIFTQVVEKTQIPVVTTVMGRGAISTKNPLFIGNLGMHGAYAANMAVNECDLLFSIGTRFNDRITGKLHEFAPHAQIVHIDIDTASISRNIHVDIPIVADAKEAITKMNEYVQDCNTGKWLKQIQEWKEEHPLTMKDRGIMGPLDIIGEINRQFDKAILVTDVGQHQMLVSQYADITENRQLIMSGGLGTMGYGLPGAIGAKIGNPDTPVISVSGDGGMQMNIQELATAVLEELPIICCIFNNEYLGMVRQWQTLFYKEHYSATVLDDGVDYVKIAEAMGATARRVTTQEEFVAAFKEALACKTPFVIDAIIDSDDKVWPMVAPGAPINEAFDEKDLEAKNAE